MKSELAFRGARVTITADQHAVCLRVDMGNGAPPAYFGADAAALIGSELERAAHYVQRAQRNQRKVEGLASYVDKYHDKGAKNADA